MTEEFVKTLTNVKVVGICFGENGRYHFPAGTKGFVIVLSDEQAKELADEGWTLTTNPVKFKNPEPAIKVSLPRNTPTHVKHIKFNGRELNLDAPLNFLDHESFLTGTVTVRGYPWRLNDKLEGIKSHLISADLHQTKDI